MARTTGIHNDMISVREDDLHARHGESYMYLLIRLRLSGKLTAAHLDSIGEFEKIVRARKMGFQGTGSVHATPSAQTGKVVLRQSSTASVGPCA